jgi:hypothetical protein
MLPHLAHRVPHALRGPRAALVLLHQHALPAPTLYSAVEHVL